MTDTDHDEQSAEAEALLQQQEAEEKDLVFSELDIWTPEELTSFENP